MKVLAVLLWTTQSLDPHEHGEEEPKHKLQRKQKKIRPTVMTLIHSLTTSSILIPF